MKRVIDGMMYNTETANRIAGWANTYNCSDFQYYEEDLYVTKKGAYFIAGEGGPLSPYSRPCGSNGTLGGKGMRVVTEHEAREWCEQHDVPVDVIAQHFEVEEA
ncbi:hypothetical protein OKW30_003538 [Paraburkholderia sp. Clong3]|uniref:hypothetical protein n=1 Tax=Paraburkholderia sp. Clong3 TaxID=2991061 RepID=UPI003D21929F